MKELLDDFRLVLKEEKAMDEVTVGQYVNRVRHFLEKVGVKESYSKIDILNYIRSLRENGYKETYVLFNYHVLKSFFDCLEIPFPIKRLARQVTDPPSRPKLTYEDVAILITEGKEKCNDYELAFLALSTVYGLRRVELAQLTSNDINLKKKRLVVRTRKRGEMREHLIPKEIVPILKNYDFSESLSPSTLSKYFHDICSKCGVVVEKGYGWHSIRRRLVIELLNAGLLPRDIHQFMRWKRAKGTIGTIMPEIMIPYTEKDTKSLDTKIFESHPFLEYWE